MPVAKYRKLSCSINETLLVSQKADADRILELHVQRLFLESLMDKTKNHPDLKILAQLWETVQFQLQDAWNFPRNANLHRFWTCPKCICPTMDNNERYGTGTTIRSLDCPLHGI